MLPHSVDIRTGLDGLPLVTAVFDLTTEQVGACAHALRAVREARYRNAEMSADDVVAMREMTSLVDELTEDVAYASSVRKAMSVARLGVLRGALEAFAAGEMLEREGDEEARRFVYALVDDICDVHADALRAALEGAPSEELAS
jgi:hypothetical protein